MVINLEVEACQKCQETVRHGGWNTIDLMIYHDNSHRWPGYAGEPTGGDFGGIKSANCSIGEHERCPKIEWCQCRCHTRGG